MYTDLQICQKCVHRFLKNVTDLLKVLKMCIPISKSVKNVYTDFLSTCTDLQIRQKCVYRFLKKKCYRFPNLSKCVYRFPNASYQFPNVSYQFTNTSCRFVNISYQFPNLSKCVYRFPNASYQFVNLLRSILQIPKKRKEKR